MAGLTFILSGGAAILARYGGHALQPWQMVLVLSAVWALWLVVAWGCGRGLVDAQRAGRPLIKQLLTTMSQPRNDREQVGGRRGTPLDRGRPCVG
jgi:hypothetical protein